MSTASAITALPVTSPVPGSTIVIVSSAIVSLGSSAARLWPPSNVARREIDPSMVATDSGWNGRSFGPPPGSPSSCVVSSARISPASVPTNSRNPSASYVIALAPSIGQVATSLRVSRS